VVFDQAKTMKIASTLGWFAIALPVLIMLASGARAWRSWLKIH